MASGHCKSNKPDLKALYRLEFYKKKKNWKLSCDKTDTCTQLSNDVPKVMKNHICNETYDVETMSIDAGEKPSILDAAFIDDIPRDNSPPPQIPGDSGATSSQPCEDIHVDSSVLAEPLCERFWSKQDSQAHNCYPVSHETPSNCLQELLCPRKWPSPSVGDLRNIQETQTSGLQRTNANWTRDKLSEVKSEGTIYKENPLELSDNWKYIASPNAFSEQVYTQNGQENTEKYLEDPHDNLMSTEAQEFSSADVHMDFNEINSHYNRVSESYFTALGNAYNVLETWNNLRSKSDPSLDQAWQYQQALWSNCEQALDLPNYGATSYARDLPVQSDEPTPISTTENVPRSHRSMDECSSTSERFRQKADQLLRSLASVYKKNEDWYTDQQSLCDHYQFGYNDSEEFIREAHHVPHSSENDPNETVDYDYWSLYPECLTELSTRRLSSTMHHATSLLRAALREQLLRDYLKRREFIDLEEYSRYTKELFECDKILDGSHLPHVTTLLEIEEDRGSHIKINMGRPYRT